MNMTVLFKKCTYWLLLIAPIIWWFCSAQSFSEWELIDYAFSRGSNLKLNFPDDTNCFFSVSSNNLVYIKYNWVEINQLSTWYYCFLDTSLVQFRKINVWYTHSDLIFFNWYYSTDCNCQVCEECQECPTIDSQYCVENNLCPSEWWEDGETSRSALYINDIQHPWSALINITIPEELQRNYTGDEEEMNIDVEWYWYDQEKMQQLVNTQYYTPTPEDMSSLVGKIADFLPLLAIMLLIVRSWYLIKKVF